MCKSFFLLCISLYSAFNLFGQSCERYDKTLFRMLPNDFPDEINCIDSAGVKQGWWIKYKVEYNPVYIPDDLPKGHYVGSFSYGKYLDGKQIGDWKTINNRHQIYEVENKNYYYAEDTIIITISSGIPFYNQFEILTFNTAMTVFIKTQTGKPTIIIECNKNKVGSELLL